MLYEVITWCGHRQLIGKSSQGLIVADKLLSLFSSRPSDARQMYRQFIADGVGVPLQINLSQGGKRASRGTHPELDDEELFDERILGGGKFVERVLASAEQRPSATGGSLAEIIDQVADCCGVETSRITSYNVCYTKLLRVASTPDANEV